MFFCEWLSLSIAVAKVVIFMESANYLMKKMLVGEKFQLGTVRGIDFLYQQHRLEACRRGGPVLDLSGNFVPTVQKERQAGLVVFADEGIQLMDTRKAEAMPLQQREGGGGNSPATEPFLDHDAYFRPLVPRVEREDVDDAYGLCGGG